MVDLVSLAPATAQQTRGGTRKPSGYARKLARQTYQHLHETNTLRAHSQPILRTQRLRQNLAKDDNRRTRDYDRCESSAADERVEEDGWRTNPHQSGQEEKGGKEERTEGLVDDHV